MGLASGVIPASPSFIRDVVSLRDAKKVRAAIIKKYGRCFTLAYAADLVAFVEALTNGES